MAKDMNWLWIVLIIAGAAIFFDVGGIQAKLGFGSGSTVPPASGGGVTPPAGNGACPDTLITDFSGDVINPLNASTTEYLAQTLRLVPDGNFANFLAYTTAATSSRTSAIDLMCDHSYVVYSLATIDAVNSIAPADIGKMVGSSFGKVLMVPKLSLLQSKAYDNANHIFIYEDADAASGTADSLASVYYSSTSNYTGTTVGVGGFLDWSFTMQTVSTVGQFGNSDLGVYIAVDADKSEYDQPSLWIGNVALSNVKGTGEVSSNDEAVLSNYEYIFKVPAGTNFKTQPQDVRMYIAAKAGQNPSGDPVLRFVGKGYYAGADGNSVKSSIFNEATNSEILTATAQTITVTVV